MRVTLSVTASGGLGGHSGSNIELGRANAIKVLGRVLREAYAKAPFRLVSLNGGKSRNAIPRDAVAVISVGGGPRAGASEDAAESAVGDRPRRVQDHGFGGDRAVAEDAEPQPMPGRARRRRVCSTSSHWSRPARSR